MLPTTILIDEAPRCVVRPTDTKDLNRFIRNGKGFLLAACSPLTRSSYHAGQDFKALRAARLAELGRA